MLVKHNMFVCVTYRKQHDGYSECDGGQYSHTDTQDECVIRVDAAVGVQQLRLHFIYKHKYNPFSFVY